MREQERLAAEIRQLSAEKDSQIAAHVREQERLAGEIAVNCLPTKESQIAAHVKEQERLAAEIGRLVDESQQSLVRERAAYFALAAQAEAAVEARRKELDEKRKELDEKERSWMKRERSWIKEALIQQLEATLSHIYSSHGWKALTVYYQLRNKVLPEGTKRREIAKSFWKFLGKSSSSLPAEKNAVKVLNVAV